VKTLILLSSLSKSSSATVITISNSVSNSKLKLDNIHDLILCEDVHRKGVGESSNSNSDSASSTKTRGKSGPKGRNQGWGRSMSRGRSQTKVRNGIACWNC